MTALPWLGPVLLVIGLALSPVLRHMPHGRFGELLLVGLLGWALASAVRRFSRLSTATALVAVWAVLLVLFVGVAPVFATLLMALACAALGGALFPRQPLPLQVLAGSLILAAVLGWLLQLPIHHRWLYLPMLLVPIAVRHQALRTALQQTCTQWQTSVAAAPGTATFAIVVTGLASTGSWLPTLQYDDLTYHLRLPWQLLEQAVYRPAPDLQIWALAPWASDVLQAVPQVLAHAEARGAVMALWLVLMAAGVWRFAAQLGASTRQCWLAVALAASLPLSAGLATSMQTEPLTAAALAWMAALVAGPREQPLRFWLLLAVLAGGLAAIKLTAGAMAGVLIVWALLRHRWPSPGGIIGVLTLGAAVGAASYVQAAWLTGNPVLPLFNGVFQSPFYAPVNFADTRWQSGFGFGLDLLWRMTFDSPRYIESHHGAAGFVLVGAAGLWVIALLQARTRAAALACTAVLLLPLLPVQYLRYAYPGIVLLCAVVAAAAPDRRGLRVLLIALCVLNVTFMANGNWMLRSGALKDTVRSVGDPAPLLLQFAPERSLIQALRASGEHEGGVLLLDPTDAFAAELGSRGRTVSWYAPRLAAAAAQAERDPSGAAWAALLQRENIRHVILREDTLTPAQSAGLQLRGGARRDTLGGREWWSLPAGNGSARD